MIRITAKLRAELEEVSALAWWGLHAPFPVAVVFDAVARGDLGGLRNMVDRLSVVARSEDGMDVDADGFNRMLPDAKRVMRVMLRIESAMAAAIAEGAS